jgi:hypothetical protein
MTALMEIFSIVALPQQGGMVATISAGVLLVPVSIICTACSVGGIIGNPSLQPFSMNKLLISVNESFTIILAEASFSFISFYLYKRLLK